MSVSFIMILFLFSICLHAVLGSYVVNVCNTDACREEAASIRMDMDDTSNPCDNFYQYACNKFLGKHTDSTHKKLLKEKMLKIETSILKGEKKLKSYRTLGLMNDLYSSCMDKSQLENVGLSPVKTLLGKIHGWPVLQGHRSSYSIRTEEIMETLWKNDVDIHPFFSMRPEIQKITKNGKQENEYILRIGCGNAGSDVPILKSQNDEKTINQYFDYMKKTAELFGASKETAKRDMKKTMELEIQLINMKCRNSEDVSPTRLEDMKKIFPGIDWESYIAKYLESFSPDLKAMDIYVVASDYLKKVLTLIKTLEVEDMRTLRNYMGWFVVNNYPYFLNEKMNDIRKDFCKRAKCYVEERPRQKICEALIRDNFGFADELGLAYQKLYSDDETVTSALIMAEKIKEELEEKIYSMKWMKKFDEMKKQLHSFTFGVGVPEKWSMDFIDKLYQELTLDSQKFYENVLKVISFNLRHPDRLQKNTLLYGGNIKVALQTDIFEGSYQTKTAHCQDIYYRKNRPQAMNYAGLGVRLFTEVLDTYYKYLKYDKEVPGQKKLAKMVKCFKERYQNATEKVRPTEIWPDLEAYMLSIMGSLNLAYRSYEKNVPRDPSLPGLAISSRQLFWLNAARDFCSSLAPDTDIGLSNEQKTNLYFSTQEQFRRDWHCSKSSKMGSGESCELW